MGDRQPTYGRGEGNASAVLHYMETHQPAGVTYRYILTAKEETLHLINNQDILKIYDEIDSLVVQIEKGEAALEEYRTNPDAINRDGAAMGYEGDDYAATMTSITRGRLARLRTDLEAKEAAAERQILEEEFPRIRLEFRRLAEALTEGREEYVAAVEYARDNVILDYGMALNPYDTIQAWERNLQQYNMLKEGFAVQLSDEAIIAFLKMLGQAAVMEVATLGLSKIVRLGQALTATARAINGVASALARRFLSYTPRTRAFIERVRARLRQQRPHDPDTRGTTNRGTAPPKSPAGCTAAACGFQ